MTQFPLTSFGAGKHDQSHAQFCTVSVRRQNHNAFLLDQRRILSLSISLPQAPKLLIEEELYAELLLDTREIGRSTKRSVPICQTEQSLQNEVGVRLQPATDDTNGRLSDLSFLT